MELKLASATATITLDDRLDGFSNVLTRAWAAAQQAEVGISDATQANLIAAGIIAKPGR